MMMRDERHTIFGDGEQGRDSPTSRRVSANLLDRRAPRDLAAGRGCSIIACGERHTLNETYALLATLLGFEHPPIYRPERRGDVRDSLADIAAASAA